jgi:hypothetical protein
LIGWHEVVSADPLTLWISKILHFGQLDHIWARTMKSRLVWSFTDELSKLVNSVTRSKCAVGSYAIIRDFLDSNVISHYISWMSKPIIAHGNEMNIHRYDKPPKLITGRSEFYSESPITNQQCANSWMGPTLKLMIVGCLRLCAEPE